MDDAVRAQLAALVAQHGRGLAADEDRVEELLQAACPWEAREVEALVAAVKEGVAQDLARRTAPPNATEAAALAEQLHQRRLLQQDDAAWVVAAWALALGVQAGAPPRGADTVLEIELSAAEAAQGCRKRTTVRGKTGNFNFPAGVTDGRQFRIPGAGQPSAAGGPAGDLVVVARIHSDATPAPRPALPPLTDLELSPPPPPRPVPALTPPPAPRRTAPFDVGPAGPAPASHLGLAIFTTLMCCQLLGLVSIIYAAQVNSKWAAGDVDGARAASQKARAWALWALWLGVVAGIVVGVLQGLAGGMPE